MLKPRRVRHLAAVAVISALLALLLPGCGQKEEAPNAPGYYSGPMKPKTQPPSPGDEKKAGGSNAAGTP